VSFAAITLCVASQQVFIVVSVYFVIGNFWIHSRVLLLNSVFTLYFQEQRNRSIKASFFYPWLLSDRFHYAVHKLTALRKSVTERN